MGGRRPPSGAGDLAAALRGPADEREQRAVEVVRAEAEAAGLDPAGAGVWRAGSAVLVGLPAASVLGRVDDPARSGAAARQVAAARLLRRRGVPVVHLVGPDEQPVPTDAGPVTMWVWEASTGGPADAAVLGALARRLHDATRGEQGLRPYRPLDAVAEELGRARAAPGAIRADLDLLAAVATELADRWPDPVDDPLGTAVVHGDLHTGNVVVTGRGPVLADLELAGVGPVSADVAPQVVAVRRYGAPAADLERFLAAYGADPTDWPGFEVLVEGYELWVTAWAVANRATSSSVEREAGRRLERWRTGSSAPWSLR